MNAVAGGLLTLGLVLIVCPLRAGFVAGGSFQLPEMSDPNILTRYSIKIGGEDGEGSLSATGVGTKILLEAGATIGEYSNGTLSLLDGASYSDTAYDAGFRIGVLPGVRGEVLVEGKGSKLSSKIGRLGHQGYGALTVKDGAAVVFRELRMTYQSSAEGLLHVSGEASSFRADLIFAGESGKSTFIAEDGASIHGQKIVIFGPFPTAIMDDATVFMSESLSVSVRKIDGFEDLPRTEPELAIRNGAVVNVGLLLSVGANADVLITDPGTTVDAPVFNATGLSSRVTIANGATLASTESLVRALNAESEEETSVVVVQGEGTRWDCSGDILLGDYHGSGKLIIKDGATVSAKRISITGDEMTILQGGSLIVESYEGDLHCEGTLVGATIEPYNNHVMLYDSVWRDVKMHGVAHIYADASETPTVRVETPIVFDGHIEVTLGDDLEIQPGLTLKLLDFASEQIRQASSIAPGLKLPALPEELEWEDRLAAEGAIVVMPKTHAPYVMSGGETMEVAIKTVPGSGYWLEMSHDLTTWNPVHAESLQGNGDLHIFNLSTTPEVPVFLRHRHVPPPQ